MRGLVWCAAAGASTENGFRVKTIHRAEGFAGRPVVIPANLWWLFGDSHLIRRRRVGGCRRAQFGDCHQLPQLPRSLSGPPPPATPPVMAARPDETATPRKIANLALIWRFTARYKGHVAGALLALLVAATATLAIPSAFKLIIDRGFAGTGGDIGRWFQYLLLIVMVMAAATALRFYFVSWLGE